MFNRELIDKIKRLKKEHGYTLHDLSQKTDIHVSTLERWFRTGHINKVYAEVVKERLGIP